MLLWLLRGAYVALLIGLAAFTASVFFDSERPGQRDRCSRWRSSLFGGIVLLTDVREKQKQITTISAIYFGLLLGLLAGLALLDGARAALRIRLPEQAADDPGSAG